MVRDGTDDAADAMRWHYAQPTVPMDIARELVENLNRH